MIILLSMASAKVVFSGGFFAFIFFLNLGYLFFCPPVIILSLNAGVGLS